MYIYKLIASSSSAFIHDIKAFAIDLTCKLPLLLTVTIFSYSEIISNTKIKIIDSIEGMVSSLEA